MRTRQILFLAALATALLAACATPPPAPAPTPPPPPAVPRDEVTAKALEEILAADHRSADSRARDGQRHPLDTLLFFHLKADMTVVEVWPGAAGWYTEILAPMLATNGKLLAAMPPAEPGNLLLARTLQSFTDKLASRPDLYAKVEITWLGPSRFEIAPPGSADLVVTFGNLHAWMNLGCAPEALAEMFRALKPGGLLGIVENRGDPSKPQDPRAASGYVNEEYAVELFEAAGFELVAKSELNANPRDTKDYEQGVWALPPSLRAGNRDRAKYLEIGESDRFTLLFRKTGDGSIFPSPEK